MHLRHHASGRTGLGRRQAFFCLTHANACNTNHVKVEFSLRSFIQVHKFANTCATTAAIMYFFLLNQL